MMNGNLIEILLVEDNPSDAELAMVALKKNKLSNEIIWLKDGKEALDFLFGEGEYAGRDVNNLPKVILMDIKMPKVSGLEVLKKVRENERTSKIPVVILTSSKEDKDIVESYELGVNSYIVKPVDFSKFISSVKDIGFYWILLNQPPK